MQKRQLAERLLDVKERCDGEELCEPGVCISSTKKGVKEEKPIQYGKFPGGVFMPMGYVEFVTSLDPGAYILEQTMNGIRFVRTKANTDELYRFENSSMTEIREAVQKFWKLKPNFTKLGLLHHRGVLAFGPPGSGKSALIQQVSEDMMKDGHVMFFSRDLSTIISALKSVRSIEPDRKVAVVMEDIDEFARYNERNLLQLLDGEDAFDNVLYIGTTNYKDRLPERVMRPGRFDKHVFVDYPPYEGRLVYLQKKLSGVESVAKIEQLAKDTKGFSFGHLRELIISVYAFEEDAALTLKRLKSMGIKSIPERSTEVLEGLKQKGVRL